MNRSAAANKTITGKTTARRYRQVSLWLALMALVATFFADIEITRVSPADELGRMWQGLLTPDFGATEYLLEAIGQTIFFALSGLSLGVIIGLLLAPRMDNSLIRACCAFVRAIHELFWALIFLQIFGFSALTGILAIAIPYGGIFARIYHDILEQGPDGPRQTLPFGTGRFSAFVYTRICPCWQPLVSYTRYRFECALRSATVLGFIGLPTLGFHLESAFKEGHYSQAAALLLLFFALIASMRWWLKPLFIPVYLIAGLWLLPGGELLEWQYFWRFVSEDIIPAPLRTHGPDLGPWLLMLWQEQIWPGLVATLNLSIIALALTGILALMLFPLASRRLFPKGHWPGHGLLIVLRSTPEMILTFLFLLLLGPSMLPAIIALGLHNSALIAYLLARNSDQLSLRPDASQGMNLYWFELLPKLYQGFLAFLFYRFEVILRESAILGILGVASLGFYIDSAFEDLRFDVAMLLILVTALLNIATDAFATQLRRQFNIDRLNVC